ncbi:acyltransferase [Burkholderia multivorans]|uniref:acyltransferase family protein n=1 Tax=Burkholderia multivorans TaxID=87883 RepID=UPI001C24D75E|nr:acyltransferase [Burkholderia multivorans]
MTQIAERNPEIEALRGVAILITIAAHLRLLFYWDPAWFEWLARHTSMGSGVDLFFCISGFVIARSVMPQLPRQRTWDNFKAFALPFWVRRIWRLWPSALVWLAVYLGLTAWFNTTGTFGPLADTSKSVVAASLQLANIYFPMCVQRANCGSNMVYWSLSLEEQFYLVFPFLIFFLRLRALACVFAAAAIVQLFIGRPSATWLWSLRTDAIAVGVLLAIASAISCYERFRPDALRFPFASQITFAALVAALALTGQMWPSFSPGTSVLISGVMVWIAGYGRDLLIKSGAIRTALVYIGSRSYAIYLVHEAAFHATREIWSRLMPQAHFDETFTLRFAVTGIVLTLALAEANYRLLEAPLRKRGQQIAKDMKARISFRLAPEDRPA